MATQLPIRVFARECPLDAAFGSVAPSLPRRNFGGEGGLIGGAARQALALEDADLDLGHVQPAGVHRGVVKLDSARDAGGGFLAQHFLEAAAQMSVEVVEHQMHLSHFGVPADSDSGEAGKGGDLLRGRVRGALGLSQRQDLGAQGRDADYAGDRTALLIEHDLRD